MKTVYMTMMKVSVLLFVICLIQACSSMINQHASLYDELGGKEKVSQIVDNYLSEIQQDERMFAFFERSNIKRVRDKLNEYLCMLTDGPCEYTGDTMVQVHQGMNITENDFNHNVDLFIAAMTTADISHPIQNKLLNRMAKTRGDMIYR